jgi:hypothetical protein
MGGWFVLMWGSTTQASESLAGDAMIRLAGIVVPSETVEGGKEKESVKNKKRAKAYKEGTAASLPTATETEEEEEGMLGPRRQPEGRASENMTRAKAYQQGQVPAQAPIPATGTTESKSGESSSKGMAHDLKAKARAFFSKSTSSNDLTVQKIGSDGIPIVSCSKAAENAAGRVGEDTEPGGIFYIMRDNKPYKVRCAM